VADRLTFRRGTRPQPKSPAPLLALLLLTGTLALFVWPLSQREPMGVLVEVAGDVPRPGLYEVAGGDADEALARAGSTLKPGLGPVPEGHVLQVTGDVVRVEPPSDPLLVGLPIDLNAAAVHELMAVPGIGPSVAGAIVTERADNGPFASVDDLVRVSGIGPATVDKLRPFVTTAAEAP